MTNSTGRIFKRECAELLAVTYLERLEMALGALPDEDLWWRPHEGVISFGTILRHLEGNVRQWILSGLGGVADQRIRSSEFEEENVASGKELFTALAETLREASDIIEALTDDELVESVEIQGFETTRLGAVLHVTEHFSWHTGQAAWIAKTRGGPAHGIAFYDDEALEDKRNSPSDR
jgi:uncharacterized damage-inducible protein DinB